MNKLLKVPSLTYRRLLVIYLGPQWMRVLLILLLLLGGIGLQLINPQLLRYFIDTATSGGTDARLLLIVAGLFILIALTNQAVAVLVTYLSENLAWLATNALRTDLVAHCLRLEMAFHKARTSGELIERIDGDVNTLSLFFSQAIGSLLGNGLLIVGIIISLFYENWLIGLAIGLFALLGLIVLNNIRTRVVVYAVENRKKSAEFFGFLSEQLAGTEDMRANGATGYVMRRFYTLMYDWLPIRRRSTMGWYSMWIASLLIFAVGNVIALGLGTYLWHNGSISLGTVYLVFYFTNLLNDPMEQIRSQLQELQSAGAGVARIRDLLSIEPTIVDGPDQVLPTGALRVEFHNVYFRYHGDQTVLQKIDFHLEAEKVLGVLGRTGSGKTTLARLLLRLYDTNEGEIRLGGIELRAMPLHTLRRSVGMVTQDVQLFHASVRDNLTFFNRAISDERILEAIEDLGLISWYRALPQGLDTLLGADGAGLSAGEAQLLAFTRVFLANPGLVILDEASSRLDPATEQLIERA
ncbi:MAG: ABC transporter ATP-binding protein, partial [Ktedonobacteraceae bacterium]